MNQIKPSFRMVYEKRAFCQFPIVSVGSFMARPPADKPRVACCHLEIRALLSVDPPYFSLAMLSHSSSVNPRDRVMKRTPSGLSSENPAPLPGTTSMMICVWRQYSYCAAPM
jgi:hypothetical protein